MNKTPPSTDPRYSAYTLETDEGDWMLLISVRGFTSSAEAYEALHYIMGPFEDPESLNPH